KNISKRRSAVERVNAYLKEYFQLNNVRYRTGKRAKVHNRQLFHAFIFYF
ncbi:transposase, partial [Tetragenococcus koreensis]